MTSEELREGIIALSELAESDYHQNLGELFANTTDYSGASPLSAVWKADRSVLKARFAVPQDRAGPSPYSGAYRAWDLVHEDAFNEAVRLHPWQYDALQRLAVIYRIDIEAFREWTMHVDAPLETTCRDS